MNTEKCDYKFPTLATAQRFLEKIGFSLGTSRDLSADITNKEPVYHHFAQPVDPLEGYPHILGLIPYPAVILTETGGLSFVNDYIVGFGPELTQFRACKNIIKEALGLSTEE